jgi:hypothetical protein
VLKVNCNQISGYCKRCQHLEDRVIQKYIKDFNGLLKEIKNWEEEAPLWETAVDQMFENAVVFAFGKLFKFFKFSGIFFGTQMPKGQLRGLDSGVIFEDEPMNLEFEVYSQGFKDHIKKGQVTPNDYKNIIIVCWKDNWTDKPSDLDIIELKDLWTKAKKL